ncbi:putative allantoate permease [Xylariaceae sp. FL0804]|nr:putative allantoate permease [Xylariaceae sp. FL0804]
MKRFTPRVWLSGCILFAQNYSGLLATRFFLGLCEAGIVPGIFYLISFWYQTQVSQKRFTVYLCSVIVASAFGSLLASPIAKMDGVRGYFFCLSDFPEQVKSHSEAEKQLVARRRHAYRLRKEDSQVTGQDLLKFFQDPKISEQSSIVVPVYAFACFLPTIVKTLGYSVIQTQLHSVPPFAAALGMCLVLAYLSDRTGTRLPYVLFAGALLIAGLATLMTTHGNSSAQYAGLCLVCMGALGAGLIVICWYLMNLEGYKTANTGGILAPFAFLPNFAPDYLQGYSRCMAVAALRFVTAVCYAVLVLRGIRRARVSGTGDAHIETL